MVHSNFVLADAPMLLNRTVSSSSNVLIHLFRAIIPKHEDKKEIDYGALVDVALHLLPIIYLGYLARQPNTYKLRAFVFPIAFFPLVHLTFGYTWSDPRLVILSVLKSYIMIGMVIKAIDLAFMNVDSIKKTTPDSNHQNKDTSSAFDRLRHGFIQGFEIVFTLREQGYDIGRDIPIPKEWRPLEKGAFLWVTFRLLVKELLFLDLVESFWKLFPPFQQPGGGSYFVSSLPWYYRYAVSTFFQTISGHVLGSLIHSIYLVFTFGGLILCGHSPTDWPPAFDHPFTAQSLGQFWGTGWHQFVRRSFLVSGGYPAQWLARKLGLNDGLALLLGTFLASGIFHELGFLSIGAPFDWRTPAFFLQHALFIIGERLWKKVTGRRVQGPIGQWWAFLAMSVLSQNIYDSWHSRGLGYGIIIPPAVSPMRRVVFPLLSRIFGVEFHFPY